MAKSEYYVDPLNGSDTTGDGLSDGTAWQTVQHALHNITKDTTDGDRINVKDTADDVLSAQLDFTTIGSYGLNYGLLIEGYTSTAGDGGVGGISGGGTTGIITTQRLYIFFKNMHLHNTGANTIISVKRAGIESCEFDNSSATGNNVQLSDGCVINCHFHNLGGDALSLSIGVARGNYFTQGVDYEMNRAIELATNAFADRNIISVDGATDGIHGGANPCTATNNSVIAASGTGTGIDVSSSNYASSFVNNVVEGFSTGISKVNRDAAIISKNSAFNCTTAFSGMNFTGLPSDNETLASTAFKKSGADTFANRFAYFEPDTSSVSTNLNGNGYRGAVAAAGAAGGGGLLRVNMNGNVFG